jgi:D-psicose/D-tagatose/L-ribulose 3-epimerase
VYPIGVNSWVWASPPTDENLQWVAPKAKEMGFDLLELPVEQPGDWDHVRTADLLNGLRLRASICAVFGPGRDLTDSAMSDATQAYLRHCIDAAVTLGAGVVAGPMYTPVGKTWRMDAAERAATVDRLADNLAPLADYAGTRGVRLALEPINRFETSFVNTAAQALEVVERVDSPALGVLLDTFHMNIEEKHQPDAIRLVGERLIHVHACGCDRGAPGADQIDWPGIAAALREIGYGGAVVIESFTPVYDTRSPPAAMGWRWTPPSPRRPLAASSPSSAARHCPAG